MTEKPSTECTRQDSHPPPANFTGIRVDLIKIDATRRDITREVANQLQPVPCIETEKLDTVY